MFAVVKALLLTAIFTLSSANHDFHGTIRLVRFGITSSTYSSGTVQIYYSGSWGNICDDSFFASTEANVICRQLGYTGVSSYGSSTTLFGTDSNSTAIEDVDCSTSSYLALLQCRVTARYSSFCSSDSNDAYVTCFSTRIWSSPYNGQLRLVGGIYSNYGRMEVWCNSQWGTVCDDFFGLTDATVACRQLGYSNAYRYAYNSTLEGSSSQPIWLDDVPCTSSLANCLGSCQSCPSTHNCNHREDVSLGCYFGSSSGPTTTSSTCRSVSVTTVGPGTGSSSSTVIAIIVGIIIFIIVSIALVIGIPICICCCLGIGLGAAVKSSSNQRVVTTTTTAAPPPAVYTAESTLQEVPPPSYVQAADYPAPYPQQQGYPQQPGYLVQDPGYPQAGYPQQLGYPQAGYPQQQPGYPQQQPGYPQQQPGYPQQDPLGYPQPAPYPVAQPGYGYPPQ